MLVSNYQETMQLIDNQPTNKPSNKQIKTELPWPKSLEVNICICMHVSQQQAVKYTVGHKNVPLYFVLLPAFLGGILHLMYQ